MCTYVHVGYVFLGVSAATFYDFRCLRQGASATLQASKAVRGLVPDLASSVARRVYGSFVRARPPTLPAWVGGWVGGIDWATRCRMRPLAHTDTHASS